jgi:hypothetical protein
MQKINIADAKMIAQRYGAEAVVIIAFDEGMFAATSYGATRAKCAVAGKWLDGLADKLTSGELPAPEFGDDCPWPGIMQGGEYD